MSERDDEFDNESESDDTDDSDENINTANDHCELHCVPKKTSPTFSTVT